MEQLNKIEKNSVLIDRRMFTRFPVKLPLRFLEGEKEYEAQTLNISGNGIGFISKIKLSPNTPLKMCLYIPAHCKPLYITGKVIWSKNLRADIQEWRTGVYLEKVNLVGLNRIITKKESILC